jgi:hypothetical protein
MRKCNIRGVATKPEETGEIRERGITTRWGAAAARRKDES